MTEENLDNQESTPPLTDQSSIPSSTPPLTGTQKVKKAILDLIEEIQAETLESHENTVMLERLNETLAELEIRISKELNN